MSIGDCFKKLIIRIQVTEREKAALNLHFDEIKIRLSKDFNLNTIKVLGSHDRGTAITKTSDLDMLGVISKDDAKWGGSLIYSSTVLEKFRDSLLTRYPQTVLGKDKQSIFVEFSDGTKIDVVPAIFKEINRYQTPTYQIPDGQEGWLETSPDTHSNIIIKEHKSSGYKFSYVIQLLKFWRECRIPKIPLSSFHMELLFAVEQTFSAVKSYAECLYDAFDILYKRKCAALTDPLRISGYVNAAKTEAQREQLMDNVVTARNRAARALNDESMGDLISAQYYWGLIFNGGFPAL